MTPEQLHIHGLKLGDEITTITLKGKRKVYGPIRIATEYSELHKAWRYAKPQAPKKCVGMIPADGRGFYFMQKRDTPPGYYYSANPVHIKAAKVQHEKARIKQARIDAEHARRMALAVPIGELLKTEYYDSEENYHLDTTKDITEELVKRLTDKQIETLKNWLKL